MISYLEGKIIAKDKNALLVLTSGGVGYEVKVVPALFLKCKVGDEVKLYTYLQVREDAQELYGVKTLPELIFFKMLVAVSGVGPRSALHILSLGSVAEIRTAIQRGDLAFLTKVSGIGKKIAERIVVELKEKLQERAGKEEADGSSLVLTEVVDALTGLGYSLIEAREAVRQFRGMSLGASEVLKCALKVLGGR